MKTKYQVEMCDDGNVIEKLDVEAVSLADAEAMAARLTEEWIRGGDWGNQGASIDAWWRVYSADADLDDDDPVAEGGLTVEIPANRDALIPETECGEHDDDHDWTGEGMGGCDENPGVFSAGGTGISICRRCTRCGLERVEHFTGVQRNPGECDTVEYKEVGE